MPTAQGSFRLFQLFGITVFLHWSWFIVAYFFMASGWMGSTPLIGLLTYLGLFGIVLMHEYGHALACRQTGGKADTIVLWPLGGVAYVAPPQRPGSTLWSIVAGPLVNVTLLPVFWLLVLWVGGPTWVGNRPVFGSVPSEVIYQLAWVNTGLLLFNLLPIYPLDGGQILQSLLWFKMGQSKSLRVAATVGLIGAVGFGLYNLLAFDLWLVLIAVFAAMQAARGLMIAKVMEMQEAAQRQQTHWAPWQHMQGHPGARSHTANQAPPNNPFGFNGFKPFVFGQTFGQRPGQEPPRPTHTADGQEIIDVEARPKNDD